MSQILDSIFANHQSLLADLDEVSQPMSAFTNQEPTLLMTARVSRWDKIGPSVLAALRELSSTVQGQQACDLLKRVTKMHEGASNPSPEDQAHFKKYGYYPGAPDTGSTPPRRPFYGDTGRNPRTKDLDPNKYYNPAGTTAKSNKVPKSITKTHESINPITKHGYIFKGRGADGMHYEHPTTGEHVYVHQSPVPSGAWTRGHESDTRWEHWKADKSGQPIGTGFGVVGIAKHLDNYHSSTRKESIDEIDQLILRHMETGLTIVRPIDEGNNDAIPQGDHTSPDPALDLQELHSSIGYILPELHALVTSTVGPEKHALLMLFNEVNTSHHELQQMLSCHNQASFSDMSEALQHFKGVQAQMFNALSPYTTSNYAVSRPPYQLKGASLGE